MTLYKLDCVVTINGKLHDQSIERISQFVIEKSLYFKPDNNYYSTRSSCTSEDCQDPQGKGEEDRGSTGESSPVS